MWLSALFAAFTAASGIEYQSDAVKAMQADSFGNPGLLWVDRGAELSGGRWRVAAQNVPFDHSDPSSRQAPVVTSTFCAFPSR